MDKITAQNNGSVKDYIASLDEQTVKDSQVLIEMMQRISGHEPKLWNVGTIGFDTYHYKYDSGREGDGHVIGFYPRKGKITVYLMDGTTLAHMSGDTCLKLSLQQNRAFSGALSASEAVSCVEEGEFYRNESFKHE